MAKVPLAGTNYIPGVTEHETLTEIRSSSSASGEQEALSSRSRALPLGDG